MRRFLIFAALAVIATPLAAQVPAEALPRDLSPRGMFMAADIVVKAVMAGLAAASVVTWTILVVKAAQFMVAGAAARRAARVVNAAGSLSDALAAARGRRDPGSRMILAASGEVQRSAPSLPGGGPGLKERVGSLMAQILAGAVRDQQIGTGVLASIGSVSPFVGLFGTVWGIMNAFIGISESQTTNLAVVAPGIAEALLATALGLIAAIPAVVFYNILARASAGYRLQLAAAGAGVERLVSRDLDMGR